jgi:hypothetical protein
LEGKNIANLTYPGSVAQRKMHFSSLVTVENTASNDLFNSVSLFIPAKYAEEGIVGWDGVSSELTADQPVVFTVNVNNFASILQGQLFAQWSRAFNQATNVDLVLYLIVFDDTQTGQWLITQKAITYAPLTKAFQQLYYISYMKMLYDFTYDGEDVVIPFLGTYADMTVSINNSGAGTNTLPAGTYSYDSGGKVYELVVLADIVMTAGSTITGVHMLATTVGSDTTPTTPLTNANFSPVLPGALATELVFTRTAFTDGSAANPTPAAVVSNYFDLALALSYQCTTNVQLSYCLMLVKIAVSASGFPVTSDVDTNNCRIRSIDAGDQVSQMTSLNMAASGPLPDPRANLLYGSLTLINALNTWVMVHSEFENLFSHIIGAWMVQKNPSGEYVGNKLSKLRLTGNGIKPFGWPSPLDNAINVNDSEGFDMFDAMNIGYLNTISDLSLQDSSVSMAHSITGFPVAASMISKWIDYWCAQDAAELINDDGTLTNPVLTDQEAYTAIQNIVKNRLTLMGLTRRLQQSQLRFPSFGVAKVSKNALAAASAWSSKYIDDLDSVTVTGGISA